MNEFLRGEKLYGDDFSLQQLEEFYKEEQDAYFDLFIEGKYKPFRNNDILHKIYGFDYLIKNLKMFNKVLGFGSADGRELLPIINKIKNLTIVESSEKYFENDKSYKYIKATISGVLSFPDNQFDLIVSFATLHHIANVSKVISEFYRCLRPGAYCLIKEPIISMGDWRSPRKGCTKNERGIPINIFDKIIADCGFEVKRRNFHEFPLISKLWVNYNIQVFNSLFFMYIDKILSKLFSFNTKYHRTKIFEKFGPCYVFYVLQKPLKS